MSGMADISRPRIRIPIRALLHHRAGHRPAHPRGRFMVSAASRRLGCGPLGRVNPNLAFRIWFRILPAILDVGDTASCCRLPPTAAAASNDDAHRRPYRRGHQCSDIRLRRHIGQLHGLSTPRASPWNSAFERAFSDTMHDLVLISLPMTVITLVLLIQSAGKFFENLHPTALIMRARDSSVS